MKWKISSIIRSQQHARELILGDISENQWNGESRQKDRVLEDKCLRIVFTENSAFEPVIANMILKFGVPVNILKADTKNVGGIAKGRDDSGSSGRARAAGADQGLYGREGT